MAARASSAWQRGTVADDYLERRRTIPLWAEATELVRRLVERAPRSIGRLLDLGSGDGFVAELVLETHPESEAVLVDFSSPMLDAAERRLSSKAGRWQAVEADLSSPSWLEALPEQSGYDAVLSGLCIHHLPHERKRALYEEVLELLSPKGLFLNWEHVATDGLASGLFDEERIARLVRVERERPAPRPAEEVAREYRERPDAKENKLLDVETQCRWLRSIGFEGVDIYFKWCELALFGGVKPARGDS